MSEIWDAYDSNLIKLEGRELIRGKSIPEGVYHLVCDVLVRHADGSFLLTQRAANKHFGGMWEASAGGSALKGETPLQCAKRELFEETGIAADKLSELERVASPENRTIFVEFLCVTNADKAGVKLQRGETQAYKWVSYEDLMRIKKSELLTERMQKFIDELGAKPAPGRDMCVDCAGGVINLRVGAIILKDGKFLMAGNERSDYLYSVGGRIKFGETAEEAVKREVFEETGVRLEIERLGFVQENYFYGDSPAKLGKLIYEVSFFYYMKVPEDFEPVSMSFTEDGAAEKLVWADENTQQTLYPAFFRNGLSNPDPGVKHIVTDERYKG